MMNSSMLFILLVMLIVPQVVMLLLVYNAEHGYTANIPPFTVGSRQSTGLQLVQEFERAKAEADIKEINREIRTMKMALTELMRERREQLEAETGIKVSRASSGQQLHVTSRTATHSAPVQHPPASTARLRANERLDPENPPNRPITVEELSRIPLKPTPWSIHPEKAQGKLCLRKWNPASQALAFIHIGKAAGTTMDKMLAAANIRGARCSKLQTRAVRSVNSLLAVLGSLSQTSCPACLFCGAHNDFHYLGEIERLKGTNYLTSHVSPVAWIREPAKREVSQFYFAQQKTRVVDQSLKFSDWIWRMALKPETIKGTNSLFADGSSGVMWFTGTVADNWVNVGMPNAAKVWEEKRSRLLNSPIDVLREAVENYNKFLWVGVVDRWDQGVELLESQANMDLQAHVRSRDNRNPNAGATEAELALLRMAYPMDAAFYAYSSAMHEKRWELYHTAKAAGTLHEIWCSSNEEAMAYKIPFYFNGERIA